MTERAVREGNAPDVYQKYSRTLSGLYTTSTTGHINNRPEFLEDLQCALCAPQLFGTQLENDAGRAHCVWHSPGPARRRDIKCVRVRARTQLISQAFTWDAHNSQYRCSDCGDCCFFLLAQLRVSRALLHATCTRLACVSVTFCVNYEEIRAGIYY